MNKKDRTSVTVPGSFPYKKWEKPFRTPEKTAGCVKCGLCQKVCPTAAINDDFVGDPAACIQCMKCVRVCRIFSLNAFYRRSFADFSFGR